MSNHPNVKSFLRHVLFPSIILVLLGGGLVYEHIQIATLNERVKSLTTELSYTNTVLSQKFTDLHTETVGISTTLSNTQQNIEAVKSQVGGVEQTVGSISGTVGTLQKLSRVDPQVLKKYSKVYFMSDNYTPLHLQTVPQDYVYSSTRQEQFLSEATPYLNNMLLAAKASGVTLYVKSAYRSFAEQKSLKSTYSVIYGAGTANSFSADQGYSEHQLGTTIDFTTTGLSGQLTGFDTTQAYLWLQDNAYRYGFVLSYPKGNTYYVYEPWHWRFVGVKLATYLHDNKLFFYNLDQRDIDTYLVTVFD